MRFTKPSKIQEKALPLLLHNPPTNMIGQSQSGTGKTAAFVLNILSKVDLSPNMISKPQALILAPSRELARQILGVCQVMGQALTGLVVENAIPTDPQLRVRGRQVNGQVIVGTPGTTMDLIRKRQLDPKYIKVLVLDEADNMLDQQGLGDQCIRVKQCVQLFFFTLSCVTHCGLDCYRQISKLSYSRQPLKITLFSMRADLRRMLIKSP